MRANLCRGTLLTEMAAVAVKQGYIQLQRVTYTNKGGKPHGAGVIEALSAWTPVSMVRLAMVMSHVRAANDYASAGNEAAATAAVIKAHKCISRSAA